MSTGLIIVVVIVIILLAIVLYIVFIDRPSSTIDPDTCDVSTDSVPSVSGIPCCYNGSTATQFKYYPPYNAVLGPNPIYWVQACSGFCQDDKVSSDKLFCETGSSLQYRRCIELARPRGCKGLGMPVAADGTRLFYINFATLASCACSGNCDGSTNCQ